MNHLTPEESIKNSIELLKIKRNQELEAIKESVMGIKEKLRPANILRNTLEEVTHSEDLRSNIGNATIGLLTGYLTKKVLFRKSGNPLKKMLGMAFQTVITGVAANHSDQIKEKGVDFFKFVVGKIAALKKKKQDAEYPIGPS